MTLAMSLFTFEMYILPVQKIPYKCLFEKNLQRTLKAGTCIAFPTEFWAWFITAFYQNQMRQVQE